MLRPSNAAQPPMKDPTVKVKPVPSPKCHSSGSQRCSNRFTLPKWDASAGRVPMFKKMWANDIR